MEGFSVRHAPASSAHSGRTELLDQAALEGAYVPRTVSWAQIDPGAFDVRFDVLNASPIEISRRRFSRGFKAGGEIAAGKLVVAFPEESPENGHCLGVGIVPDTILITRSTIDMQTRGPASFIQLSIDVEGLRERFSNAPDVSALANNAPVQTVVRNGSNAEGLRAAVRRLLVRPAAAETIQATLVPLVAATIEDAAHSRVVPSIGSSRRHAAVRACEEYMRAHVDSTITLLDLSAASGLRTRSLINAFEAVTGLSPIAYLKRLRLSGVRQVLRRADRATTRIIDVATEWGFWHMGHFTSDYRAMFGELPSQTLSRR